MRFLQACREYGLVHFGMLVEEEDLGGCGGFKRGAWLDNRLATGTW
jgi:hypothetical protein